MGDKETAMIVALLTCCNFFISVWRLRQIEKMTYRFHLWQLEQKERRRSAPK